MVYVIVLLFMRGSDWSGHPNPAVDHVIRIAFMVVFAPPHFFSKVLGGFGTWAHGLGVVVLCGLLWGIVLVWIGCRLSKRYRRTTQQSPSGDVLEATPEE